MRQFLFGLSVSGAFILGCVVATTAQSTAVPRASATPYGVPQWEYKCSNPVFGRSQFLEALNDAGRDGWELVTVDPTCFKRPL